MVDWHRLEPAEVAARLASDPDGPTATQADERLPEYGPNLLERSRGDGPRRILWRQIDNPLSRVLLVASAVAIGIGKVTDGLVVLAVVVLNSLIGVVQEYRASRAIKALLDRVPEYAIAIRDGEPVRLAVEDLIPFESELELMARLHRAPNGTRRAIVKGAPEVVPEHGRQGPTDAADVATVLAEIHRMASAACGCRRWPIRHGSRRARSWSLTIWPGGCVSSGWSA